MAIRLDSQSQVRQVQTLPFCYVCAKQFDSSQEINGDHVPPTSLFASSHRDFPLILPTHTHCNNRQSADDEVIGQLVSVLHGRTIVPHGRKPDLQGGIFPDGSIGVGATGLDLKKIIWRWVRGFHAALYQSPVREALYRVFPPLPEGRVAGNGVEPVPVPPVIQHYVQEIKRNRATGTLDSVVCRKGHCRYECVWTQADGGQWFCVWALDVYGWSELGHDRTSNAGGALGCIGKSIESSPEALKWLLDCTFRLVAGLTPLPSKP